MPRGFVPEVFQGHLLVELQSRVPPWRKRHIAGERDEGCCRRSRWGERVRGRRGPWNVGRGIGFGCVFRGGCQGGIELGRGRLKSRLWGRLERSLLLEKKVWSLGNLRGLMGGIGGHIEGYWGSNARQHLSKTGGYTENSTFK
jgi:hypothetical protein